MPLPSYSDVFCISHDSEHNEEVRVGDRVRTGPNLFPHFEVIAVSGAKAWVRDLATGADSLALLSRCRLLERPLAMAAE